MEQAKKTHLWFSMERDGVEYGLVAFDADEQDFQSVIEEYLDRRDIKDKDGVSFATRILEDVEDVERLEEAYQEVRDL